MCVCELVCLYRLERSSSASRGTPSAQDDDRRCRAASVVGIGVTDASTTALVGCKVFLYSGLGL